MRGYSEFKGVKYRLEFDILTQSFIQRALKSSPVSPAQGEAWHEGEEKSPPVSLAFIPKFKTSKKHRIIHLNEDETSQLRV